MKRSGIPNLEAASAGRAAVEAEVAAVPQQATAAAATGPLSSGAVAGRTSGQADRCTRPEHGTVGSQVRIRIERRRNEPASQSPREVLSSLCDE